MGNCDQPLSDGNPCGLQTEGLNKKCPLHKIKKLFYGDNASRELFTKYIDEIRGPLIDLSGLEFSGWVDWELLFKKGKQVAFIRSHFVDCEFSGLNIYHDVSFKGSHFTNTKFDHVNFLGNVINFAGATFINLVAPFYYCYFEATKDIDFTGATFDVRPMPFSYTSFNSAKIIFNEAIIESSHFYVRVTESVGPVYDPRFLMLHGDEFEFESLKFNGHFEYTNGYDNTNLSPTVIFSHINFSQMKSATFLNANLEKARFVYTNLDNVYFANPRWPEKRNERVKRWVLYDELNRSENTASVEVRRVYVQLLKNYEVNRDFEGASHWHFREMDCRKKALADLKHKGPFNWVRRGVTSVLYLLYRLVSQYGENYHRPLLGIFGVWFISAWAYLMNGFPGGTNYEIGGGGVFRWHDCLTALFHSSKAMLFQLPRTGFSDDIGWNAIYLGQLLLTVILVPLFLLALRRRFRR